MSTKKGQQPARPAPTPAPARAAAPMSLREENEARERIKQDESAGKVTKAPERAPGGRIKVRATKRGYYDNLIRRPGDVFVLHDSNLFSDKWMERVAGNTPDKTSTSGEYLEEVHQESRKRVAPGATAVEGDNPIDA